MKDGIITERNKDGFWPWVLGAAILLGAGGIGLYLLRDSAPVSEPALDVPVATVDTPAPPPPAVVDTGAAGANGAVAAAR